VPVPTCLRADRLKAAYEAAVESDDDADDGAAGGPPRTKNEAATLPPVEVHTEVLEPTVTIAPLGRVTGVVEAFVLVESDPGVPPLDAGSMLCLENRRVLGPVRPGHGRARASGTHGVLTARRSVEAGAGRAPSSGRCGT